MGRTLFCMAAGGAPQGGKQPNLFLRLVDSILHIGGRWLVGFTFLATLTTLVLGARELFSLDGPGWAIVLASFNVFLVAAAVTGIYFEQWRRRREIASLQRAHRAETDDLRARHATEVERLSRNARVAAALTELHRALERLRDAAALKREGAGDNPCFEVLIDSLQSMAQVFAVVTGAPCRMSVKELETTADAPDTLDYPGDVRFFSVRTLYRNEPARDPARDQPTPLHENSDFRKIWDPLDTDRCFFSNDLDHEPGYTNPHRVGNPVDFEYNATIVWPIQRRLPTGKVDLLGYLCVDTLQREVLRYDTDFNLGAAYADTLYTALVPLLRAEPETDADATEGPISPAPQ